MAAIPLREQLLAEFDRLPPEKQFEVIEFTKNLNRPRGVPAHSLLKYAGRSYREIIRANSLSTQN